jgi:hypothetical protein
MDQASQHHVRVANEPGIVGPGGRRLTRRDLPSPKTKRWVIRRKAEVVSAVRSGLISLEEACEMYNLSVEEFLSWQRLIDAHGVMGLRATRLQQYRDLGRLQDEFSREN